MKQTKHFRKVLIALVLISSLVTFSCKKGPDNSTVGTNQVYMENIAFNPSTITVAKGTTVTWTNKDNMAHTVNSTTNVFSSNGQINPGSSYQFTFTTSGTFTYQCLIHNGMTGTVVVQ
jgi:plastocyanin